MERRDFLLEPLLSDTPGQSVISTDERTGEGEDNDEKGKISEKSKQDYVKAKAELDALLRVTRPKNLRDGVSKGLDAFVVGSIGAIGAAVLIPTATGILGAEHGGFCGAMCGVCSGCVCGILAFFSICAASMCGCCVNTCRGAAATPSAVVQPLRGNYWDDYEGRWINMNLYNSLDDLRVKPHDDSDILGAARAAAAADADAREESKGNDVADTKYYDVLGLDSAATIQQIKHRYYTLARKVHPDIVDPSNTKAISKFQELSEAYNVLSDSELRHEYDSKGLEGLSADRTSISNSFSNIDPVMLYAFLFGSSKLHAYIGTLAAATAADIADSMSITENETLIVQRRRCLRLAAKLLDRIECYILGDEEGTVAVWKEEAETLVKTGFGYELVEIIGMVYTLTAIQFLGSLESGVGLPSICAWANAQAAARKLKEEKKGRQKKTLFAGMSMLKALYELQKEMSETTQEDKKRKLKKQFDRDVAEAVLTSLWATTAVDITTTIHSTCNMVFFDKYVDKATRIRRAKAVQALGETFMTFKRPEDLDDIDTPLDAFEIYEKAAFSAMLETIKRKDESKYAAKRKVSEPMDDKTER